MAVNKNAILRYQTLDRCFRNPGKKYKIEDLVEECNDALAELEPDSKGVKKRQIYDDIRFMKSEQGWHAPIESQWDETHWKEDLYDRKYRKKKYYRYTDPTFSINNQPINEMEANQIRDALAVLSRVKGIPHYEWIHELIPKLEKTFGLNPHSDQVIAFDENMYLAGIEHLGVLFNAIYYKKILFIDYKPYSENNTSKLTVHPYFLKQYNNRWFLFGYSEKDNMVINLALDRIIEVRESHDSYDEKKGFDPEEYFEDIIGVTRLEDAEMTKITLRFSPSVAPYIKSKPLHGSQKRIKEDESGLTISIEVLPNYELESQILSHGEHVEILGPDTFREKILKRMKDMVSKY